MTTTLLPPSVAALNRLLDERRADARSLRATLAISYLVHAAAFLAAALWLRNVVIINGGSYQPISVPGAILPITPIYNPDPGQAPGPRPKAQVMPPIEEKREPEPPPPVAKEPEPEPPVDEADAIPERTPNRRTPPPVKKTPSPAVARAAPTLPPAKRPPTTAATPAPAERPVGGVVATAKGGPGSPLGTLSGHPDGGLQSLAFTDNWYVNRIRDLIYGGWQNPFVSSSRPATPLDVTVSFRILRTGQVVETAITTSSGNAGWDRSGLRAVEDATLPPLPGGFGGSSVAVDFSFHYDPSR